MILLLCGDRERGGAIIISITMTITVVWCSAIFRAAVAPAVKRIAVTALLRGQPARGNIGAVVSRQVTLGMKDCMGGSVKPLLGDSSPGGAVQTV